MKYDPDKFLNNVVVSLDIEDRKEMNEDFMKSLNQLQEQGKVLEKVDCLLCGSSKREILLTCDDNTQLCMCTDCGLFYSNTRPTKEALAILSKYYLPSVITDADIQRRQARDKLEGFETELALINQDVENKKGLLLDVGVACGDFLFYAREEGWKVCGTELSILCMHVANEIFKIPVFYGELHELNIEEKTFDVVTMRHVAEHFRNPLVEFKKAHTILKDGGLLLVTTPYFAHDVKDLKRNHMLPLHIVDYSPKTIRAFMEKAGFDIIYFAAEDVHNMTVLARKISG